jgi:3-isopropylmalate dehydrogenase
LAIEESINTYKGVERVIRDAFNRAATRPRKKLTLVHKNNVLARAGGLWTRVFNEVAKDFPQVTTDYLHVDAASMFFVTNPDRFDVVVTDNLFGDIITDIAAAVCGGIGLAASGNINPTGAFPSMFEPVHGSAPDIAGKNIADPTATVLSIAMMLNHLGQTQAANEVEEAVAKDLLNRGEKKRSTSEIGDALVMGIL